MTLRMIDTFSGIGGFSLAAQWLGGFQTVQFVEKEPYCQRILRKHWPDVPIHDDICTFSPQPGSADVVVGGFPCQDISIAGKQAGIKESTRSGLFYELMRVVRLVGPRYVVLENVSAILANGLDTVLGELAAAGFDAEWACIPASAVGACHQRDRWWLLAYPSRQQCHDRGLAHATKSSRAATKLGDGYGADAANPQSSRRRARQGQGARQAGYQSAGTGNHSAGSDAANSNNQRQQEQHTPAIADQQGRPRWHDASRRLNPDW